MKAYVKTKQQQLSNKYSSGLLKYIVVTVIKLLIIKHINCVHDLHLKPVSHRVAISIQETASQLTDELPVYNSTQ